MHVVCYLLNGHFSAPFSLGYIR